MKHVLKRIVLRAAVLASAWWLPALSVAATCSISMPSTLSFGAYDTINALQPAAWTFTVTCNRTATGNTSETVALTSAFSVGSGTYAARTMSNGSDTLVYNLYMDATYTTVRGDGTGGTVMGGPVSLTLTRTTPTGTASGSIYGRISGGQTVSPGVYATTTPIVLTINY